VDVDRFETRLPELFEDFPRSEHPRRRRFDDILEAVPNLARENNLSLVNVAAVLLEPGESYVEAGTYMGASLIAAARENEGKDLVGIDDFSFGSLELPQVDGRSLPAADRARLDQNLARFGVEATILEGDAQELLRSGALGERRVGVYYYDAGHSYEQQLEGLKVIEPYLADSALLIVDDSDWADVERATRDYLAGQPRAQLLFEIPGREQGQPQWWEGVTVLGWT
jgi:predicted O-methyltransferase YrrM